METLTQFIPKSQYSFIKSLMKGEEGDFYKQKLTHLESLISTMPQTYDQDGSPDPIIHLHYFYGGSDWYITEKDSEPEQLQAYGYVILNGNNPELGYIPITQIIQINSIEIDLHFTPTPASQIPKLAHLFRKKPPTPAPASDSEQAPPLATTNIIQFPTIPKKPLTQRFPFKN